MTKKTYDRITMICMAAAACSALLFDKFPEARLAIGLFGAIAGAGAVVVYFWNQWARDHECEPVEPEKGANQEPPVRPGTPAEAAPDSITLADLGEAVARITRQRQLGFYEAFLFAEVRRPEESTSVSAVIELVERLFIGRGRAYEIVVDPDGRFTIRPPRRITRQEGREAAKLSALTGLGEDSSHTAGVAERERIAEWADRQGL